MTNYYDSFIGGMISNNFEPSPLLKSYIVDYCFYENSNINGDIYLHPIPNCKIELHILLNSNCFSIRIKDTEKIFKSFVIGLFKLNNSASIRLIPPDKVFEGLYVTFTNIGAYQLIPVKLVEINNSIFTLEELWGNKGIELIKGLNSTKVLSIKAKLLDDFFLWYLSSKTAPEDYVTNLIYLFSDKLLCSYNAQNVASSLNISYRTLHRWFQSKIGICPKEYLKIRRFNSACALIKSCPDFKVSDIIYKCGYYDQAHFIHEFKQIMKISPSELTRLSNNNFFFSRPFIVESA